MASGRWDDDGRGRAARPRASHRRPDGRRNAHDQREDHSDRTRRLPDVRLQGANDLQPVVREERHRRGRGADGCPVRRLPRVLPEPVPAHEHPWRARDDAAQGRHHRARRRADPDRDRRRRRQRGAPARGRDAGGRPVRRRRVRARRGAQGFRARGQARARRRQRRRRVTDRGLAGRCGHRGHRPVRPQRGGVGVAGRAPLRRVPGPAGHHRLEGPGGLRHRRQRHPAGHERRRPAPDGRRPDLPGHVRRRGRDEADDHAVPARPRRTRAARSRWAATCSSR